MYGVESWCKDTVHLHSFLLGCLPAFLPDLFCLFSCLRCAGHAKIIFTQMSSVLIFLQHVPLTLCCELTDVCCAGLLALNHLQKRAHCPCVKSAGQLCALPFCGMWSFPCLFFSITAVYPSDYNFISSWNGNSISISWRINAQICL